MDAAKVDLIIRYVLARAAREDTPWARELGAIHLLKFLYLADLAFAQRNGGRTFTAVPWRFYNYGPWSPEALGCIRDVIRAVGATERRFEGTKYDGDRVRWFLPDEEDAEELLHASERELPAVVTSCLGWAVHKFTNDTSSLLHYVYTTSPMLHAAPGESLDFAAATEPERRAEAAVEQPVLSRKAEKRQEAAFREMQERAKVKLAQKRAERAKAKAVAPPRYDDVFFEGQQWLEEVEGGTVEDIQGEVEFTDEVWKSPWRSDPGAA